MPKKLYDLSEEDLEVLQEIKRQNKEITSDVAAIRFLIRKYKYDVIDPLDEKVKEEQELLDTLKQIRLTLNIAEKNSEVILDVLNTFLFKQNEKDGILKEEFCHPFIEMSEQRIKDRIAHNKQKKDFGRK